MHSRVVALLVVLVFATPSFALDTVTVTRVVDGDTLEVMLDGRLERIRLIGVDTPEFYESDKLHRDAARTGRDEATIRALGKRASDFTKSLVHAGDRVQLEYDQQRRDRYKRLLAFVWLPNGQMLNEVIVCEGYANAYTRYPFRQDYLERFRACERQAREAGKGLWAEESTPPASAPAVQSNSAQEDEIRGNRRSKVYHLPRCPSYNQVSPANAVLFATEAEAIAAGYRKAGNCR